MPWICHGHGFYTIRHEMLPILKYPGIIVYHFPCPSNVVEVKNMIVGLTSLVCRRVKFVGIVDPTVKSFTFPTFGW